MECKLQWKRDKSVEGVDHCIEQVLSVVVASVDEVADLCDEYILEEAHIGRTMRMGKIKQLPKAERIPDVGASLLKKNVRLQVHSNIINHDLLSLDEMRCLTRHHDRCLIII